MSFRRVLSLLVTCALLLGCVPVLATASVSAIDPDAFSSPGMQYRPGVRWWWPGNAASTEDLVAQVDYLADNGFGMVEIVAFAAGFLQQPDGLDHGSVYSALDDYDKQAVLSYDTPEYYAKLKAVVQRCNERGIIVDLNAGSGYLANDDSMPIELSQSNLALGRATLNVSGGELKADVPEVEVSPFYAVTYNTYDVGEWTTATLKAVVAASIVSEGEPIEVNNQAVDLAAAGIAKTYANRPVLDLKNATLIQAEDIQDGTVALSGLADGDYELIAIYSTPTGSIGLNSIISGPAGRAYVADHLSAEAITAFVNGWLNDEALADIVATCDVRAVFNDSYEFYTDSFFNDRVYELAKDQSLLGYDVSRFVPMIYEFFAESFFLSPPTAKIDELNLVVSAFMPGTKLIDADLTEDEAARVLYDYNQLINVAFQEGMQAFSNTLGEHNGLLYRQQAYNPPIDTLKSSKYVDIPETEGLSEYDLKRVTSGAHLYGKNLITSEVYTLGSTPFNVTPQFIKNGYDLMATSGVNNFFYHGLSATYYGTEEQKASGFFGEEGWRAWPTIGVEMASTEALSTYYGSMNAYASRANFSMQSGKQSSDVAVYMPLFGALAEGGGFGGGATAREAIGVLNTNGYAWDAINDDCIQSELTWKDGKLVTAAGMEYQALVVDRQTLPVDTMKALQALAAQGASIVFYGELPNAQPGYADGKYAEPDAEVAAIATEMTGSGAPVAADESALVQALTGVVTPKISYARNESVRFNRRALPTGGELAYIRNTGAEPTDVVLKVDDTLSNLYWLDQATGNIYSAQRGTDGATVSLPVNGAIILLAEPEGCSIDESRLSAGLPLSIDTQAAESQAVEGFTLTVQADNIGGYIPGELTEKTYEGEVLGSWTQEGFLDGELAHVSAPGVYQTKLDLSAPEAGKRYVLNLGEVNSAAAVSVNGQVIGQVYCAPFEIDVTAALLEGENQISIEVQPLKVNRRIGLKQAYEDTQDVRYRTYASHVGTSIMGEPAALVPAGLTGPVTLNVID